MDDLRDTHDTLAVGDDQRLRDEWIYPYFACHRNRCGVDQGYSGAKAFLTIGILESQRRISDLAC